MPKGWFNLETGPEGIQLEQETAFDFLHLSRTTRLYCFITCLGVGFVLSILGSVILIIGQLWSFALLYTLGILISLAGTGFLIGFFKQLKMMFAPVRVVATIVFLGCIGLVFVGAFVIHSEIMAIVLVVVEYLAYTWYCLSYVPYARAAIQKMIGF